MHSECDDDFEFFGEWELESFLKLVEETREKEDDVVIVDFLSQIQLPYIDKARFMSGMKIRLAILGCYGDITRTNDKYVAAPIE